MNKMYIRYIENEFTNTLLQLLKLPKNTVFVYKSKFKLDIDYEVYNKIMNMCSEIEKCFIEQNENANMNLNPKWAFLVIETYFTFTFRKSKINFIFAK